MQVTDSLPALRMRLLEAETRVLQARMTRPKLGKRTTRLHTSLRTLLALTLIAWTSWQAKAEFMPESGSAFSKV